MGGFYKRRHIWLLAMQTYIFPPHKKKLFKSCFFPPKILKVFNFYFIWHMCTKKTFPRQPVLVATDVSFMKQPFHFRFALTGIFYFSPSLPAPSPRCLSLFFGLPCALGVLPSFRFLSPSPNTSAGKIDLIKNEKDYLREMAA